MQYKLITWDTDEVTEYKGRTVKNVPVRYLFIPVQTR